MRKLLGLSLFLVLLLSACGSSDSIYNFKIRKDDYFISEDGNIIVDYKTNADGKLVELTIDRLLTVEDMLFFNPLIDYDYELEGFTGDIFTDPGFLCTNYNEIMVPINIEVGSTRFKYDRNACEYQEVDRSNIPKSGSYSRRYPIDEPIGVSSETVISIVAYDENSIEKFVDIIDLPHTVKMLGVYSIQINSDRDGFNTRTTNYFHDIGIYEQLVLKHQENETAMNEVMGFSMDINLLDFDEMAEIIPLVEDFETDYAAEIAAIDELEALIGVISDDDVVPEDDEDEEEPDGGDSET